MASRQDNIAVIQKFYEEVFNAHDVSKIDEFMRDDYMQHNATVEDGKEGFINFTKRFFEIKPHMEIKKIFANDNDEVAVFFKCICEANGSINKVVDIFRLQDGKLAEHWDVVEHDVSEETNSGWGLFTTITPGTPTPDPESKQANVNTVLEFNRNVFDVQDFSRLDEYMRDDYTQHNPYVPDKKAGFIESMQKFFEMKPEMKIYKTFTTDEGDVLIFFKCICHATGMINKVVDMYRLQDGKLAEHWDIVEHNVEDGVLPNGRELF